jgi:hypothetical protein
VNLVTKTHVPGELEYMYLFAAFSVFSVVAVHWSPAPQDAATPHEITILAAYDNAEERTRACRSRRGADEYAYARCTRRRPTMSSCDRHAQLPVVASLYILRLLMNTTRTL